MEEDDFKILTPGLKGTAGVPLWARRREDELANNGME